MWLWHRRLKKDVFAIKVEDNHSVIFYNLGVWEEDLLAFFEPPHEH